MRALIVEDEILAADNLIKILNETGKVEIITILESIHETIEWFSQNKEPDILFLDIHLADGSAFEIFEKVQISCPIIFTTAYDEYAIKAFKVNSIDYLLKPLVLSDVRKSLEKYKRLTSLTLHENKDLKSLLGYFKSILLIKEVS